MNFRMVQCLGVKSILAVGVLAAVLVAGGCAATSRAPSAHESGFLGADYDLLRPGDRKQAQLVYLRSGVSWATYKNVLLDPVTVWKGKESTGQGISATDEQILVNYFYSVIRGALEKEGFMLVSVPQPGTLRVKVAITKAEESNVGMNVVSTVVPALHALSSLDQLATGKPAFVGEAQIEVKVTDSVTGQLLAAGIDHRVGGKALDASMLMSWGDVEAMMRLWAGHGTYNLCRLQNRANCVPPATQ
ncbi:MAG: DUF3313 domain-containing protein [Burkholderiales bacterium]